MSVLYNVGIGDFCVKAFDGALTTTALGSCVGVVLYDPVARVGGLAHIMLPSNAQFRSGNYPAKFADTAIPAMCSRMVAQGASKYRVWAKIAGGAHMFALVTPSEVMRIGERNVAAVREVLDKEGIRILAADTGQNYGRSLEFSLDSGQVLVKTIEHGIFAL